MATLTIQSTDGYPIDYAAGSGLGFFGPGGFGYSVAVGSWQSRTFITNTNGTTEGAEIDNNKWINATGVTWGVTGEEHLLTELPNDKATININFTHSSAVNIQNAELRAYDGTNVDNAPSGIEIRGAEILHPYTTYVNNGSGDTHWTAMSGANGILSLSDSPGSGALVAATGGTVNSTRHDYFVALSASPSSVGAKTGKFYISLEYL